MILFKLNNKITYIWIIGLVILVFGFTDIVYLEDTDKIIEEKKQQDEHNWSDTAKKILIGSAIIAGVAAIGYVAYKIARWLLEQGGGSSIGNDSASSNPGTNVNNNASVNTSNSAAHISNTANTSNVRSGIIVSQETIRLGKLIIDIIKSDSVNLYDFSNINMVEAPYDILLNNHYPATHPAAMRELTAYFICDVPATEFDFKTVKGRTFLAMLHVMQMYHSVMGNIPDEFIIDEYEIELNKITYWCINNYVPSYH